MSTYDCLGGDEDGSQTAYMPTRVTRDCEVGGRGPDGDLYSARSSGIAKIDSDEYNREWEKHQPKGPTDKRVGPLITQMRKLQETCEALEARVNSLERNSSASSTPNPHPRRRAKPTSTAAWKALNG
jgi:hypothetical protein